MKILAIDSSGLVASLAVLDESNLIAEYTVNYKKTHSQILLPMLEEIMKMTDLDLHTLDAIAIAGGPGSFTGLRIGSATVKGLGLALDKPIIHVPTLEGLAYNLYDAKGLVCPIMDARRNQVYTGIYRFEQDKLITVEQQCAIEIDELLAKLNTLQQEVIFLGDGVPVYQETIKSNVSVPYQLAPAHMNRQRAGAVGALAIQYFQEGKYVTAREHAPDYLRVSQAERERMQKQDGKE